MLEIRKMEASDLDQVAYLEQKIFSLPWTRQGLEDALKQDNTLYLVALKEQQVAGYCGLLRVLDEADITNVAVAEEYRGMRIGHQMLLKLLEEAVESGIKEFTLEVRESNQSARRLYKKLGFVEEGLRKNFYEKPIEHAVIMWMRR